MYTKERRARGGILLGPPTRFIQFLFFLLFFLIAIHGKEFIERALIFSVSFIHGKEINYIPYYICYFKFYFVNNVIYSFTFALYKELRGFMA
jgi:hypothetical protein